MWIYMSWYRPGYICLIDESLDSKLYIQILKEDLQMSIEEWQLAQGEFIFQYNNDSKHTTKITKAYLDSINLTEAEGIILYWPAQSPDLNPIEHIWAYLKRQLSKYRTKPKSCQELWERISVEWYKIPAEFYQTLIKNMLYRLRAVARAKGKQTKY